MKAFTNTDLIESRTKWARRIAPLTMLFLIGGLITNFMSINQPEYFRWTLILLATGFFLSIISSSLVNQWVREPRTDQALAATLKKFGNDFIAFNYTSPVPHVLLTPSRLYVIVARRQGGEVTVKRDRISRQLTFIRILRYFADEGMGSPVREAEGKANKLQKYLRENLPGQEIPEVTPMLLFTNKDVNLTVVDPVIPTMRLNELKTYLREVDKQRAISAIQRESLIKLLGNDYPETQGK